MTDPGAQLAFFLSLVLAIFGPVAMVAWIEYRERNRPPTDEG